MQDAAVKKVVIAGGGTAGWITASILSSQLGPLLDITLVESDQIGTIGVGEATIPTHRTFHRLIGVDEAEFMRACRASFKLGIAFENWGTQGDRYIHSFGKIGKSTWLAGFQHMWRHAKALGFGGDLDDYCFELQAAEAGKFETSDNANINYAYHLDASLYAAYLRGRCEAAGVQRVEGKITHVRVHSETGAIEGLDLDGAQRVDGDFFVDCTGFRALLIGDALGVSFDDWSHWLPMDRAVAVQTRSDADILPYTRSIAQDAGWRWRIPLQHRVGNGHVFSSAHMSDDEAQAILMDAVDGKPITDPRVIKFRTGQRTKAWEKNAIAIGLSSGFLEPLESTSIHLIQIAATRLVQLFPFNGPNASVARHFNRMFDEEMERIRNFIILHYKMTQRDDTPFWRERAALDIPDTLKHRIALFQDNSIAYQEDADIFRVDSWIQVMRGQGLESDGYHHAAHMMPPEKLSHALDALKSNIANAVERMPRHQDFLKTYCGVEDS